MQVSKVSFGKVIAASGKEKKMKKITQKLDAKMKSREIIVRDVTGIYKNTLSGGEMAKAAQRGDVIDLFVSGKDAEKMRKKEPGWSSINEVLSHLEDYININDMSIGDVISRVLGKG